MNQIDIRRTNFDQHKDFIPKDMKGRHVMRMYIGPQVMTRNGIANYSKQDLT